MIRYLPYLIEIALLVYCLIDCIQTDVPRNLSKTTWVFVIILLPIVGGIAWLVAGRPEHRPRRNVPWPTDADRRVPRVRAAAPDVPGRRPGVPGRHARVGRQRTSRCSRTGRRSCATGSSKLQGRRAAATRPDPQDSSRSQRTVATPCAAWNRRRFGMPSGAGWRELHAK